MADPNQVNSIHPDLQPRSNLVQAGSSGGTAPTSAGQDGVTYDEGEGVKQTVMISGPMSEAYTRALHLCFTKDTVQDPADIENEVPAIESQQEDNSIISSVIAEVEAKVDNNTLEKVGSTFDFADVKDDLDDDNVTTRVYTAVGGQATQPEFVDAVQSMSHNKRVIVAVVAQPHGEATGVYLRKQFIELNDGAASQLTMGEEQELQAAAEALYTPFGVKMVFGMSGVVKALAQ